jgi:hypothetical protein
MTFTGDCCAKCFIANVSGYPKYDGFKVLEVEQSEWKKTTTEEDEENFDVKEQMGIKLKTDKGYFDLDTRVEHNGFYGGRAQLSTQYPLGQYGDPWNFEGEQFEELVDF